MSENGSGGVVSAPKPEFSEEVMEKLFYWARDRVASAVAGTKRPSPDLLGDEGKRSVLGAFVSFKKRGRLRSCMGHMAEGCRLVDALDSASVYAALHDPRFPQISASEFYDLDLEVWALGSFREILEKGDARREAFLIGRDGLQIQGRGRRGLLLPSVPVELGWNPDQFLEGLCDKAGLARGSWRQDDVQLFAFEGVSFKKPFVWNLSRNEELAKIVEEKRNSSAADEGGRATYSFANGFGFGALQAPPSPRRETPRDLSQETRPAAVAGMFYPRGASAQKQMLDEFQDKIDASVGKKRVSGAMVPHAGWIFSGRLATDTLSRIEAPETIVVLAPKHRREGAPFAVMPYGTWDYTGGTIANDLEFVDAFVKAVPSFQKDALAHRSEHSIEVQLPIIARLFPKAKVVGLLIGAQIHNELDALAGQFASFLESWEGAGHSKPLLLISSDMNHYANEARTRELDGMALSALETLDAEQLYSTVARNDISMCGVLPACLTLATLSKRGELHAAERVGYATSGAASGDFERVVGYAGYLLD